MSDEKLGPFSIQSDLESNSRPIEKDDQPLTAEEVLASVGNPEMLSGKVEQILAELQIYAPRFGLTARGLLKKFESEITAAPLEEDQLPPTLEEKLKEMQSRLIADDAART